MKALFLALTLFVSGSAYAANGSGNVSNVIGLGAIGASTTNIPSMNSIPEGDVSSAVSGFGAGYFEISTGNQPTFGGANVAAFYRNGTQYVVTAAHTAICTSLTMTSQVSNTLFQIVAAPSAFSHNTATVSMPGGTLYQGGAAGVYTMLINAAQSNYTKQLLYVFQAGEYPGLQNSIGSGTGGWSASLICKEI